MKIRPYADTDVAQVLGFCQPLGYGLNEGLSLGKRLIPDH
jgi:hypothetical protein